MGKVNALLHGFNVGEHSRAGMARVDQERVKLAAEIQENLFPYVIGKALIRPGTQYLGAPNDTLRPELLEFVKSVDDTALLELTNNVLRIWVDDGLLTRISASATITNGDFGASTGWTLTTTGGATANINSSAGGALYMAATNRGGLALAKQEVTTASLGSQHALAISVGRGPVTFQVGASEGGDEYIGEVTLDTGIYSLAFTPTGISAGADAFTKLLLHFEGLDGATTTTDSSLSSHTVTFVGNAQIDTAQFKIGTSAILFDGSGDYITLPDSADFAFGTGDFTIDFWLRRSETGTARHNVFGQGNAALSGGYHVGFIHPVSSVFAFGMNDESIFAYSSVGITDTDWHHVAIVRNGSSLRVAVDGVFGSPTSIGTTAYTDSGAVFGIGCLGEFTAGSFHAGWIDEFRISKGVARWTTNFAPFSAAYGGAGNTFWVQFATSLERAAIVNSINVEAAGVVELTAPWSTDELREIQWDQSLDVIFLAHENWQQRKIERLGNADSWGVSLYQSDDGPFGVTRSARVRLKPGATRGNTTLTAENAFFHPEHVGTMFRLTHEAFSGAFGLGAENTFTDPIRINAIGTETVWNTVLSGTFVGTVTEQRSLDGPDSGFADTGTAYTTTHASTAHSLATTFDNVECWIRYGFKAGAYTSGAAVMQMLRPGYSKSGVCRVTGYTSPTAVSVEVLEDFGATDYTDHWQEGEWSTRSGWPTAVGFFDGRLWWAGADKIWGSESDDYYAFNLETEGDAGSIQRNIATGGASNTVNWLLPLQRLIVGTTGSESSARASSFDQPLTPTNLTLKDASTQGSALIAPAKMDGRGLFVHRSGTQIFEVYYSLEKQDYISTNLTKFNDEICGDGALALAVQRQPQSYVWMVREDGQCPILIYDPGESVAGWLRFISAPSLAGDAEVESIAVLPADGEDTVYLAVKRTINGATARFIEKLMPHASALGAATSKMADAGTLTAGPVSSVTLAHLASETGLVGWGTLVSSGVSGPLTGLSANASGVIALGASYTNVWVGLKYNWRYKSSKLAYAAQGGTALLQRKRVTQVGLLAADIMYGAIQFGPDFDTMDPLPLIKDGTDVSQTTVYSEWDEPSFPFRGGWDTDSRLCMKGSAPYVGTLLGIVAGIDTRET